MTGHDIDPISFQLGQMSARLTDIEAKGALDRLHATEDRKRLGDVEQKTTSIRAQIGLAVVIFSGILYGAVNLVTVGVSQFGAEIKAGIKTLFHGGP